MRGIFEEDRTMREAIFLTSLMFVSASVLGMSVEKFQKASVKQTLLDFSKVDTNKRKAEFVDQDSSDKKTKKKIKKEREQNFQKESKVESTKQNSSGKKVKRKKVSTDRNKEKIRELENQLDEFAAQEEANAEEIRELNGKLDESLKKIENLNSQLVSVQKEEEEINDKLIEKQKENEQLTRELEKLKESNRKLEDAKQLQVTQRLNSKESEIENLKRQLVAERNLRKEQVQISQNLRGKLIEQNEELEQLRKIVYQRKQNSQLQTKEKRLHKEKSKYDEMSDSPMDSE